MNVGVCKIKLRLPENQNLKGKRHLVKSITTRVHSKFNVAIAEVEDMDLWQLATLGVVCVSNGTQHANQVISHVVDYIEGILGDAELLDYETEFLPAL